MFTKYLLSGLVVTIFLVALAFGESGFQGTVTYTDCDCGSGESSDEVKIWPVLGGSPSFFRVDCGGPSYTTGHTTFPGGSYYLVVIPEDGSDCDHGFVQQVYHPDTLTSNQVVNLTVIGPTGGGN